MPSFSKSFSLLAAASLVVATSLAPRYLPADDPAPKSESQELAKPEPDVEEDDYKPKSSIELRRSLSTLQYNVTQNEATETAFRNRYWNNKRDGIYQCIVCERELFSSATKYKSGTGWPSFYAPLNEKNVGYRSDRRLFYVRTEVHCKRCGAHLGHVFDDGPPPTGKRYCMNSASMKFVEAKDVEAPSKRSSSNKKSTTTPAKTKSED